MGTSPLLLDPGEDRTLPSVDEEPDPVGQLLCPAELTEKIREWVEYYNHQRYHEAINNVTPADKYWGRDRVILKKREMVRKETMKMRRELNRMAMLEPLPNGIS